MKTAIITAIDDRVLENFEKDFLSTLRGAGQYKGPVFAIYYGNNDDFIKRVGKKNNVKFLKISEGKNKSVSNRRFFDLPKIFNILPNDIDNLLLIDSGDIWFQKPIDGLFDVATKGCGVVEENYPAEGEFNKNIILNINDKNIRDALLKSVNGFKLINAGMIVGSKDAIRQIVQEEIFYLKKINQDIFAIDQTIFNYIVRRSNKLILLENTYNYTLISEKNNFFIRDGLIYSSNNELPAIVHNCGSAERLFKNGRKDLPSAIKELPKDLPGTFWGITTFFNPVGYKNKILNYRTFRQHTKRQGLKLLTVECVSGNADFELNKDDADVLLQIRTNNSLWQKERLLNIGMENLPKDCDKFAWLDADIIFLNDNWIKETSDLLEKYVIVQPFSTYLRLPKNLTYMDKDSFEKIPFSKNVDIEGERFFGIGHKVAQVGTSILKKDIHNYGQVGLAWAARREIFDGIGLFDKSVFPCVDLLMAHIFYSGKPNDECRYYTNENIEKSLQKWADIIYPKVGGSVYYTNGPLLHLWHGNLLNRNYEETTMILRSFDFDPEYDIEKDKNGCWTWSSKKIGLDKAIRKYFYMRNEGDSLFIKLLIIMQFIEAVILRTDKNFKTRVYFAVDRFLGRCGVVLRRVSPKLYPIAKKTEIYIRNFWKKK